MKSRSKEPEITVVPRPVEEMSDYQIEQLINFGRKEAELLDRLEAAARASDHELVWEIAQEFVRYRDEAHKV